MSISAEREDRGRHDPRACGRSPRWFRWRPLTGLCFGLAVFVGLWLTVTPADVGARWAQLALGALAVAGVMASSRLPVLAVLLTAAATASAWVLSATADPFVLTGFATFRLAETRGGRRFPWWMLAGAIVALVSSAIFGSEGADDRFRAMLLSTVVLFAAWVLGVRTQEVRDEAAARSRAEERLRLARDVHDVLSHSLGVIGVQAGVAAHVATLSADELRDLLRRIEGDARSSLSELRDLLHRERAASDVEHSASTPLSAALAGVAQTAERAGVTLRLDSDGAIDALPVDVRTTLLRVVQEAVTNVVRHAAASSAVATIRVSTESVTIGVEDNGQGGPGVFRLGHGLTGMRERIELLGGRVNFVASSAGFAVRATLPLQTQPLDGGHG